MDPKDRKSEMILIKPPSEAEGIRRRTFLKGLLATGAVTSLGGLGPVDLKRAEAAELGKEQNLYQKIIGTIWAAGK